MAGWQNEIRGYPNYVKLFVHVKQLGIYPKGSDEPVMKFKQVSDVVQIAFKKILYLQNGE